MKNNMKLIIDSFGTYRCKKRLSFGRLAFFGYAYFAGAANVMVKNRNNKKILYQKSIDVIDDPGKDHKELGKECFLQLLGDVKKALLLRDNEVL